MNTYGALSCRQHTCIDRAASCTAMRSQGFASPCVYRGSGTGLPLKQNGAIGVSRQELGHSSRTVKLYLAVRHTSTSASRSSRARVRPRSEHAAATQHPTVLLPAEAVGGAPSFLDTRLASSVMAGDDHTEQFSLVQQRGAAATPAAVWRHGHGTSSGGLGGKASRSDKHQRQRQQHAQRVGARGRSSSGIATAGAPATATHQEVSSLLYSYCFYLYNRFKFCSLSIARPRSSFQHGNMHVFWIAAIYVFRSILYSKFRKFEGRHR